MASKKLGELIKEARVNADLTQEQLKRIAKATGVTQASLLNAAKGSSGKSSTSKTAASTAGKTSVKVTATEKKLIEQYPLPDIELLVVSHHGSKHSSTTEFLETLQPETAVISVGDNSYGHPSNEALLRLVAAGCEIYRTDLQGNVLLTVKGEESWQAKTK